MMPNLKFPEAHFREAWRDRLLYQSIGAEFLGLFLFQLLGSLVTGLPLETALLFAAIMYGLKFISGGHLNPAVSLAAAGSGHIDWTRGLLYAAAQFLGALLGALTEPVLIPDARLGHRSPGCIYPASDINDWQLFMWEAVLTFLFILVLYSAVFTAPGHGDAAPLAAGLALYAALATGGQFTGFSPLNPARTLAATLFFKCDWSHVWVYLLAQLTGIVLASSWALGVYGRGPHYTGEAARRGHGLREQLMQSQEPGSMGGPVHDNNI